MCVPPSKRSQAISSLPLESHFTNVVFFWPFYSNTIFLSPVPQRKIIRWRWGVCVSSSRFFRCSTFASTFFSSAFYFFTFFFFQFECCPYKTLHSHRKAADGFTLGVLFWFRLKFTSLVRSGELYSGKIWTLTLSLLCRAEMWALYMSIIYSSSSKTLQQVFSLTKSRSFFLEFQFCFFFAEVYIQQNFLPKSIGSFKNPSPRRRQKFPQISLPKSIAFPRFLWWRADSAESLPRRRYVRCGFLGPVVGIDRVIGNNVKWHIEGGRGWAVCVFSTWSDNVTRTVSGGDFD